jgi:hypothetical protein
MPFLGSLVGECEAMFKKTLLISFLFVANFLSSHEEPLNLTFYRETEHFQACCLGQDCAATDSVMQDLEQYWVKWNHEVFAVILPKKIKLDIFPDIRSYNLKIFGSGSYPGWRVCTANESEGTISLVSPKNPGPVHSEESIMKAGRLCLGWIFTHQKYGMVPFWLCRGLAYSQVKIYSKETINQYLLNKNGEIQIPSLANLEEENKAADRPALIASYILTEFLVDNWGLDKTLALLNDYSSFERILGISKDEFRARCARHYQPHEQAKKR